MLQVPTVLGISVLTVVKLISYLYFLFCFHFIHCVGTYFSCREKKQKIQDIRKNVKDAIVVSGIKFVT